MRGRPGADPPSRAERPDDGGVRGRLQWWDRLRPHLQPWPGPGLCGLVASRPAPHGNSHPHRYGLGSRDLCGCRACLDLQRFAPGLLGRYRPGWQWQGRDQLVHQHDGRSDVRLCGGGRRLSDGLRHFRSQCLGRRPATSLEPRRDLPDRPRANGGAGEVRHPGGDLWKLCQQRDLSGPTGAGRRVLRLGAQGQAPQRDGHPDLCLGSLTGPGAGPGLQLRRQPPGLPCQQRRQEQRLCGDSHLRQQVGGR